jgi:uncharacterized membrane protein
MGGRNSRPLRLPPPPPPLRPSYRYYNVDNPSDANRRIDDGNRTLSNNNNIVKPDLQKKIKAKTDETIADSNTKTDLDKQIASKIAIRDQLNNSISNTMAYKATVDDLIVKTEGFTEGFVEGNESNESKDANNSAIRAIASMQNYYSSLMSQNTTLSSTISKHNSATATNDRKFIKKETNNEFYLILNYYLFIFYYVFLALLVYVYFFVQIKMGFYIKLAILAMFVIFPFISLHIEQFLYYIYRVCYAFVYALPYVPATIV